MAVEGSNTLQTLDGFFKEAYADKLGELIPDGVKLLNKVKFLSKDKQPGNNYHQPVILGMEHGVTFAGSDEDAFALAAPVAGQVKDATVKGSPAVMRSLLGYVAASRAAQGGSKAFMDATKHLVANMLRSMTKKLEISMLYGQSGYATVDAVVAGTTLQIKDAEWAPGIWAGAEGMPIDLYEGDTLIDSVKVSSVNMETKQIVVNSAVTLNDGAVIWHAGAKDGVTHKEMKGIHSILKETGSLFGISTSSSSVFKGNVYDAAGEDLSFTKLGQAATRAVEKGQEGTLLALVNPRGWQAMLSDQAALRSYDQSYSSAQLENGGKSLKFHSQNGEIQIEPSLYVKEGHAFLISVDDFVRVGSSDVTFKRPGQGDQFFRDLEGAAAYELRLYTDQAVFCSAPGRSVLIENIVNS